MVLKSSTTISFHLLVMILGSQMLLAFRKLLLEMFDPVMQIRRKGLKLPSPAREKQAELSCYHSLAALPASSVLRVVVASDVERE